MGFGGTYWMDSDHDQRGMAERNSPEPYSHTPPPPPPLSINRMVEILLPIVLASGMTGAITIAVVGERLAMCKENIDVIQQDLRELRRDLYRPLPHPHQMRTPWHYPNQISEQEHDA